MTANHPRLFEPLDVGARRARNRIVRAATTTNLSEDNGVSDRLIAHYAGIARGGTGTLVTEALRIHPSVLHGPFGIAAFREEALPGLERFAAAIHDEGALLIGQLNHSGRQHTSTSVPPRLVGPSPVACPRSGGVPHELTAAEVSELADGYVRSGLNIARAGFDGVELNGAQGHLLQQFLSPFSNIRDDRYGGDADRRARLALDILGALRAQAPADFAIGYRLGVDEFTDGGLTTELTRDFALRLQDEGLIDYVSFSQGNFNSIATHLPDRHHPRTPFAHVQEQVGRALDRVVRIACTGIVMPEDADRILAGGWADAVALGRALTVDPRWAAKAEAGRDDDIRPCIQCNHCWSGLHEGLVPLTCVQNAEVGRELELRTLPPADPARHVVVVGGGPAGMETARVAVERGHSVTLLEAEADLGGKAGPGVGDLGGVGGFEAAARWLARSIDRAEVRLGVAADAETVLALDPDVVVVATGAAPEAPTVRSDDSVRLVDDVSELPERISGGVLVFDEDGHYWAAQVAEEVARRGGRAVVVTRFFEPFRELPSVSRIAALRSLDLAEAEIIPMHELVRFEDGTAVLCHYDSRRERVVPDVHAAVWVGPQHARSELVARVGELRPGLPVHLIGDARAPRRIRNAIREGYELGRRV
ncbi:oxidoreductase [Protaetiibacter mangrovi]|uniref:FAD-dependent oxidoreductase n=1 Tax=Protaetiibacter mangrovi TaxID=2970926 RepID=A0ABT1ZGK6_9MICO|nr:FAD-dependent oxidoreductase [Protaetiibacter mangrovi]MCS0499826.1 FAD-dependent oxidoreductase [Protaetiibacter mangrovi]